MTVSQPNFSALFAATFEPASHPIRYEIRNNSNLLHDLAFMSSLVHDARVLSPKAKPKRGVVEIALNRDCWEIDPTDAGQSLELPIADSRLTLTGVEEIKWSLAKKQKGDPWIDYLWIDPKYRTAASFNFFLVGCEGWKCSIRLIADEWTIELEDKELPYLWSTRYSK